MSGSEVQVVHRYAVLEAHSRALGLTLGANQLQFLLRDEQTRQVYACCSTLDEVDTAVLCRAREMRPEGARTRAIQGALSAWPPRSTLPTAEEERDMIERGPAAA